MEFKELLKSRHSVRDFADKEIEPEKVAALLKAAQSAPSAGDLQSYKIYVVRSREVKGRISAAAYGQAFLSEAPALLVFCADRNPAYKYGERGAELYSVQDATIAASYAQLAATDEGLGAVWVGAFDPLEVSRLVKAQAYEVPVAVIAVGYPAAEPGPTPRKPLEELVKEV